jgi:putative PIN family toxin of toxin-antitoxin system
MEVTAPDPLSGSTTVVLDTNVLLALWLFRDPVVESLHAALAAHLLQPVRSVATDAEFAEVLARPELFSVAPERQARLLDAWQSMASPVEVIQSAPWVCRDPLDQKFLDLAVSVQAGWLISRDRDLLKLARKTRRQGLLIVTPERWSQLATATRAQAS